MASNVISEPDKAKMFDYLKDYQDNIKPNFGKYNLVDKKLQKFLSVNDIYIGRLNQKCKGKAINHQYHILYEQNKPKNKVNDEVHHLLRHLRNAIAHGRIRKKGSKLFQFSDETPDGNGVTMIGEIDYKLFFELIDLAKKT
jgi:hypothetical protein